MAQSYGGRSPFFRIPYMITDDRMTGENNAEQMRMLDGLLRCSCPRCDRAVIQDGVYEAGDFSQPTPTSQWQGTLSISPQSGSGNSSGQAVMGFLGGDFFDFADTQTLTFSVDDVIISGFMQAREEALSLEYPNATDAERTEFYETYGESHRNNAIYVFVRRMASENGRVNMSIRCSGASMGTSASADYNQESDLLLCTLELEVGEDGKPSVERIVPGGAADASVLSRDPHGERLSQTRLEVGGNEVYGAIYGSFLTVAEGFSVPVPGGHVAKFASAYPEDVSAGVVAWTIAEDGKSITFRNAGAAGVKVNYRLELAVGAEGSSDGD